MAKTERGVGNRVKNGNVTSFTVRFCTSRYDLRRRVTQAQLTQIAESALGWQHDLSQERAVLEALIGGADIDAGSLCAWAEWNEVTFDSTLDVPTLRMIFGEEYAGENQAIAHTAPVICIGHNRLDFEVLVKRALECIEDRTTRSR